MPWQLAPASSFQLQTADFTCPDTAFHASTLTAFQASVVVVVAVMWMLDSMFVVPAAWNLCQKNCFRGGSNFDSISWQIFFERL